MKKLRNQERYCSVICTETWVTYWHYTQHHSSLVFSFYSQASLPSRHTEQQCTKHMNSTKCDLQRNQPGHAPVYHRSDQPLTFQQGKQKVFFPFTSWSPPPPALLWNLPALFAFGSDSTLTSGPGFLSFDALKFLNCKDTV